MARSKRHSPFIGLCSHSDKAFKVIEHRRFRRATRLAADRGLDGPHPKQFGDPWRAPKDGKAMIDDAVDMRK